MQLSQNGYGAAEILSPGLRMSAGGVAQEVDQATRGAGLEAPISFF